MPQSAHSLIVVPGHASFKAEVSLPLPLDFHNDEYWALQDFQKGEPPYYVEHIQRALELADDESLIIFSGGRTREDSGRFWSEARTYDEIAKTFPKYPNAHVALEEYAKDSFQNLEFSIRKFVSLIGHEPARITVVGWKFKEKRFQLHAQTLEVSLDTFQYLGVNNPDPNSLRSALAGEERAVQLFTETPLGDGGLLEQKRYQRDPWNDGQPSDY